MIWADHAWILPAIPAISFVVLFLFGRKLPRGGDFISVGAALAVFVLFFFVLESHLDWLGAGLGGIRNVGTDWINFDSFVVRLGFTVDSIAMVMVFVVATVALMVNIYSTNYLRHHGRPEPRYWWYFAVLSLFVAMMLTLVLALVLLAASAALALILALRGEPAAAPLAPVIEIVEGAANDDALAAPTATPSPPAVQVILAAETPERLILEGPAIPTVIITDTPAPLSVGLRAAVYGVGVDKLNIRNSPSLGGSQVLFRESEGKLFDIIGGPQEADGFTWWQVRDPQCQVEGWAVAIYLRTVSTETGG